MTWITQNTYAFKQSILDQFEQLDTDIRDLNDHVSQQSQGLELFTSNLMMGLFIVSVSASLLLLTRHALELWLVYHPTGVLLY
ncbi:hypothetical protein HRE53_15135 [Acaryochloris sp. 'Moss Beach']|uniref:hypothetical protein n=1 Tax=Acaryochloris TaxID=155977 RepID=UPI001BB01C26|nr:MULTISPECIES: hypothetical protein [Acaryochloris]QUY43095.1 hypothetical protein I1H34_02720 [Acaryochloris marina S15]UJB67968.1 hypothetical protein HRE53_15135 [Acaryochloris sp. 'Moss Beach']